MADPPPARRLQIDAEHTDGGLLLRLRGELDVDARERFLAAAGERRHGELLVDAGEVTFVDSSGLAALVIVADGTRRDGAAMRLVAMSDVLRSLLARTGLLEHLGG